MIIAIKGPRRDGKYMVTHGYSNGRIIRQVVDAPTAQRLQAEMDKQPPPERHPSPFG